MCYYHFIYFLSPVVRWTHTILRNSGCFLVIVNVIWLCLVTIIMWFTSIRYVKVKLRALSSWNPRMLIPPKCWTCNLHLYFEEKHFRFVVVDNVTLEVKHSSHLWFVVFVVSLEQPAVDRNYITCRESKWQLLIVKPDYINCDYLKTLCKVQYQRTTNTYHIFTYSWSSGLYENVNQSWFKETKLSMRCECTLQ